MKRFYLLAICCLLLSNLAFAKKGVVIDKETKVKPATAIKIADRMYAESYYYNAVEYYRQALMVDAHNRYAIYWLAKSYYMSRDYEQSLVWFEKFKNEKAAKPSKAKKYAKQNVKYFGKFDYDYGCALQMLGKYDDAIAHFDAFPKKYTGTDKPEMEKLARAHSEGSQFAKEHAEMNKVKIAAAGKMVNNAYTESAPCPIGDSTLYFTSLNSNKLIHLGKWKNAPKAKLYRTVLKDGQWTKTIALPEYINDPAYEIGNSTFSPDGQRMYFTKCYHPMEDEVICNLFMSQLKNGKWSEPVRLNDPVNDSRYTSTQPTVRAVENGSEIIYFVSDRPGGVGDMDIWYFTRNRNGDMKGPNCMPKPINTVGNEHTPSYDNNKHILYFSSDGHPGFGGFDVFSATQAEDMTWQKPVNMGRPVNSEDDDLYYTPIQGNVYNAGYMVSNRKGTTELNSPTASDDIFRFEDFKYGLEGMITRADGDGSPVKDARVFLYVKDASGNDSLAAIDSSVTPQGTYFFKLHPDLDYKVVVERAGFSPKEEFISTKDLPMEDTLQKDFSINMNVVNVHGKIYRDVDPSMTALKDVTIIISEKTKTGLHLVSTYSTSDTNPNFASNLEKGKIYTIAFRKSGYFAKSMEIDPRDFGNVFDVTKDIPVTMMEMDKSYTLSNIYYEFGKATLTASSEKVLDELKNLLDENPSIIIELSSHTDSKGADGFNMQLSQKRAESCVNYLLSKGVLKKRMIAKGYGESKPLVPNTTPDGQDDEEGRAKNRRTEFKIVGELKSNVKVGYQDKDGVKK